MASPEMMPRDQRSALAPSYYDVGFVSPTRRRFSPLQNSRWFDNSHRGVDHNFRGGRFAGRRFQPGQSTVMMKIVLHLTTCRTRMNLTIGRPRVRESDAALAVACGEEEVGAGAYGLAWS
ncbi:hypothetical protein ACFX1X_013583 [Malus domestica]